MAATERSSCLAVDFPAKNEKGPEDRTFFEVPRSFDMTKAEFWCPEEDSNLHARKGTST